jgi:acetamidase/formamidase
MRQFTRAPNYTGPDDPERGEIRGPILLDETIQIETVGGHDQDYLAKKDLRAGAVMEVDTPRHSRPGGPFYIDDIKPGDWVAIDIIDMDIGPYGFYRNGGPHWGSIRLVAPVLDGLIHFPPDFVVPIRPMIGYISLASVGSHQIDTGGNMDFNAVQPGSTIHIRAQKAGGLMMLGDVHARMGDGELTGTGVEIDSTVTLRVRRSGGFPCSSPVVEKTRIIESPEEFLTSGKGADWEEAVKNAWSEMVALISDHYDTTAEYANLIVGTIADARPGYAAGMMNRRGGEGKGYVTCQLAITRKLTRTGAPYEP